MKTLGPTRMLSAAGQRTDLPLDTQWAQRQRWEQQGYDLPPWEPVLPPTLAQAKNASKAAAKSAKRVLTRKPVLASAERVAEVLAICNDCPTKRLRESDRRCSACGCYVDAKAQLAAESCPDGHWAAVEVPRRKKPRAARAARSKPRRSREPVVQWPPDRLVEITERHLIYHIYPVAGSGTWQWNVEQLLRRTDLFNGVRSIAVLTPGGQHTKVRGTSGRGESVPLDSVETVQAAFAGHRIDNWIIVPNDPKLREVVTRRPLIDTLPGTGVTFSAHTKGATFDLANETIRKWAELMYAACLDDWGLVQQQLREHYMTGCFRCQQAFGKSTWHYSGTFYWFRNDRRILDSQPSARWLGTEEWPGITVRHEHAACVFGDGQGANGALYRDNLIHRLHEDFFRGK